MKNFYLLIVCFVCSQLVFATGTIRGTIYDGSNGEPVMFANVLIKELGIGTTSDLDGAYELEVEAGTYTVEFSFIGYSNTVISEVVINEDDVTILDATLSEEASVLDEIVVTAKQSRNTEAALATIQRKSANLLDGVSSQTFKRVGDSDAASAVNRVTGVSVEGGKHVYVRGLGDRYTKTIMNGVDIPGLDPDRNTVQMDLFPTNLIDNIIILKSFTPDYPGDFTGGLVNIVTKDFPEEKQINISGSLAYNPDMHLNNQFLTYNGGNTDWLGFDDGTRSFPRLPSVLPSPSQNIPELTDYTKAFSPTLGVDQRTNRPDGSLSASFGNQYKLGDVKIGVNAAANYSNSTEHYDRIIFSDYVKPTSLTDTELLLDKNRVGVVSSNNVLWSGLLGLAVKTDRHKVNFNLLHVQNGETKAGDFNQESIIFNSNTLVRQNLEYSQRSITNFMAGGTHSLADDKFRLEWKFSPTLSLIEEPDIRSTSFQVEDGRFLLNPSEGALSIRLNRELQEVSYANRVDGEYKIDTKNGDLKLKGGGAFTYKDRDYSINAFDMQVDRSFNFEYSGDPDELLQPENIWSPERNQGTYVAGNFEPTNTFSAQQTVAAAYVMSDIPVTKTFKAIVGVRYEKADNFYTGQNNQGDEVYDNEKVLDESDFLPSVNLVYEVVENMNLRASFTQTLARPSFKEKSIAQIQDLLSGRTFIGNIDLEQTNINNYDIRWEYFLPGGQVFSVSGFYKTFKNPIELVAFNVESPDNFTPRNVGNASVLGIEIEAKRKLDFLTEKLSKFMVGTNVTLVNSEVQMNQEEIQGRRSFARDGQNINNTREMVGQSPYIVNAFLSFIDAERGWDANVSYNVQGERLSIVGLGRVPDVFEKPFNSLNVKVSKKLGADNNWSLSLKASNVLNDDREQVYKSFNSEEQLFFFRSPGVTFSLGASYTFR